MKTKDENNLKKRLCIFSIFDKQGIIDDYLIYYLQALSSVVNRIVFVVNGDLAPGEKEKLEAFSSEILFRENKGYDAGAHKYALMQLGKEELLKYDELIMSNDTCYGPLCPFEEIFEEMEDKGYEVWGLNGYFNMLFSHIQSYFLVFSRKVLEDGAVYNYFDKYIDEHTENINLIYCSFEVGLFDYLIRTCGYSYGYFCKSPNLDLYESSYLYISKYRFPLIKKKIFQKLSESSLDAWNTLAFVNDSTDYNLEFIINNVKRIYGHDIKVEDIKLCDQEVEEKKLAVAIISDEDLEAEIKDRGFYIYGTGMFGYKSYWRFGLNNPLFKGFVISDGRDVGSGELFGLPVMHFSDLQLKEDERVIVGLGPEFTKELMPLIEKDKRFIRIF